MDRVSPSGITALMSISTRPVMQVVILQIGAIFDPASSRRISTLRIASSAWAVASPWATQPPSSVKPLCRRS